MSRTLALLLLVSSVAACGDDSDVSPSPDLGTDAGARDAGTDLGLDGGPIDGGQCDVDGDGVESEACGGDDCDDEDATQSPGNVETCDLQDNDCDGDVDEGVAVTAYRDADGDGFGDASESMQVCALPTGYVNGDTDCDDSDAAVNPGNPEVCDTAGVDENCDGTVNEGCDCEAGTVRDCMLPGACAGATQTCVDGTFTSCSVVPTPEVCEGSVDEDCDGTVDEMCD